VNEIQTIDKSTGEIITSSEQFNALIEFGKQMLATGFLPKTITQPGQVAAIILTGRELGLPPMTALRHLYVLNGRVGLSAEIQLGMFVKQGGHVKWLHSDNEKAVLLLQHQNGDEHTEEFTVADAQRAGLMGKDVWKLHTKRMLRARCASGGLTAINPGGNLYDPDEIDEIVQSDRRTPPPVVIQLEDGKTEVRDAGAPERAQSAVKQEDSRQKKANPLVAKVNEAKDITALAEIESKWGKADKAKFSPELIDSINKAIEDRKLAFQKETTPIEEAVVEEIPGLDSLLQEKTNIPLSEAEWIDTICKIADIASLTKWQTLVKLHVETNPSVVGAMKKRVMDCIKAQSDILTQKGMEE
jgi:hypothetical protein